MGDTIEKVLGGTMLLLLAILVILVPVTAIMDRVGETTVTGIAIATDYKSWPWPRTQITFAYDTDENLILEDTLFYRSYYGRIDLELGQTYRITAFKPWYWVYSKITDLQTWEATPQ